MLFNYIIDNSYVFYSLGSIMAGFMGYKFVTSVNKSYFVDKGIQTDAWENYSDRPSLISQTSPITTDAQSPVFSPMQYINEGVQTSIDGSSTATTTIIARGIHDAYKSWKDSGSSSNSNDSENKDADRVKNQENKSKPVSTVIKIDEK